MFASHWLIISFVKEVLFKHLPSCTFVQIVRISAFRQNVKQQLTEDP